VSSGGRVHDAGDSLALDAAFRTIYGTITADPWVVTDVMGSNIIFNGNTSVSGVSFNADTLSWDLTEGSPDESNPIAGTGTTLYTYRYTYRVTLDNLNGYVAGTDNDTNDSTVLTYVVKTNGVQGPQRTAQFTSPVVEGYAANLKFQKVDKNGKALEGAKFGLWLAEGADPSNLIEANAYMTATSGNNGNVLFLAIPSGHAYYIKELEAPQDFILDETVHVVTVAYGALSINLLDSNAKSMFWFK